MRIPPFHDLHWDTLKLLQAGHLHVHFSQWGEDVVLWHYLREKRNGFYVDIGAHHPHRLSNTALLHHYNGWSGINVDPDPELIGIFKQIRPNDTNLCCGVGAENGQMRMAFFEDKAVNSFDPHSIEVQVQHGGKKIDRWHDVEVRTLASILDEHMPHGRSIDVMNVDVEGWDLIVLQSNDWSKYQPSFILVEDHKMNLAMPANNDVFRFLTKNGYRLIAQTLATSIYKKE